MRIPFPIKCWLTAIALSIPGYAMSQSSPISFTDRTNLLVTPNYSGVCMAIADMNADGKDDIVRYYIGRSLNIEYQNNPNQTFSHRNEGAIANFSQWSNCIADVDKNGYNDILVGGKYDNIKILYNQDGLNFNSTTLPSSNIFLQGSNFIDLDNDGWVDIFACHDEGNNRQYKNNGNGQFEFAPNLVNTITSPPSDNSGSYGSVWTDYDNDNDLDLYISKCKAGVDDPSDPRRMNMLLENDGNNNFSERAEETGLDIGAQSWLAEFADIDNDGDMDAFIGNHYTDSQLMRNNGNGTYTDITASSGLMPTLSSDDDVFCVQTIFRDFNNDGFVDLLFVGSHHFLFYNNGNRTFTPTIPFEGPIVESFALGDLNSDGFVDVYAGYANFFTQPSNIKDALFMNDGNSNNFIAVQLEGIESNINGIGARVEIYGDWGVQIRDVRSGEGYGIMNSLTQYFGIGRSSQVDRLVIKWPSGIEQTISNPQINQFHEVLEKLPCQGQTCNDGDDCTTGDVYDAYCNCQGVFRDSDNDGVCDRDDICPGYNDNIDSDNDGEPDGCDDCPSLNNNLIGQLCDDGNDCTSGERYNSNCDCAGGSFTDSDNDGVCDSDDQCPGFNDSLIGQPCNDNNPCTTGERYNNSCGCSGGIYTDADNDGVCAGEDSNDNDPCVPNSSATPCVGTTSSDNCQLINYTDFESNDMGVWIDGGSSAKILTNASFAASGNTCFSVNGNAGSQSSIYTSRLTLQNYTSISVSFSALPYSMEQGDSFVIEIAPSGTNYSIAESYTIGNEISNNRRLNGVAFLSGYNLTNNTTIRIRTTTDESADYIMLDNLSIEACGEDVSGCAVGQPCDDGNICTTGERYDNNCNCTGGTELDSDSDGICDAQDNCPQLNNYFIGRPCNDNDPCTIGERYDSNCGCSGGTITDNDGDGYCAAEDANDNNPCVPEANNPACNNTVIFDDCSLINSTGFENGYMGIWLDGGTNATLVTGTTFSNNGLYSFYVKGDKGSLSSLVSGAIDLRSSTSAILKFSLLPYSVENGDKLVVEIATNGTFIPYQSLISGQDITNNIRKEVAINIDNITFSSSTVIRLRSESDSDNDYFIFDDISLEVCSSDGSDGSGPSCTPGTVCSDGDPCTSGETFDSNCNCTGGVFVDSDFDGVCDAEDQCPTLNDNLIGAPCEDGNACTTGERYDSNCNCTGGVYTDNDADGYCVGVDSNDNDPCIPNPNSPNCDTGVADCANLSSTDFENSNMGIWLDGGSSAKIITSAAFANSGSNSFYIHDDNGFASSLYSRPQDYSAYNALRIEFYFFAFSVENGDRFQLEIDNGDGVFRLIKSFVTGVDFPADAKRDVSLYLDNISYSNRVILRFRSVTDETADYFIFDDISIEGCSSTLSCTPGAICNDNNACTIGERYDNNCNCTGGVITDNDNDGYCSALDSNDNDPCVPDNSSTACISSSNLDCKHFSTTNFENNILGIWNDGGGSARILINSDYANSGSSSFYIHADNGSQSSLYSDALNFSGISSLRLSFYFTSLGIIPGDKFHVEVSTGGSYSTFKTYTAGIQFAANDKRSVELDMTGLNLSSNTSLRFRAECENDHYILIDDIRIETCEQNFQDQDIDTRSQKKKDGVQAFDKINIYPNPTTGLIFIDVPSISNVAGNSILDIYNLEGSKIQSIYLSEGLQEIDLSGHASQLYLFRISNDSEVITHKIFKQ